MKNIKVVAIIVTYEPCSEALDKLVTAILPQVTHLVLVDNASALSDQVECRYAGMTSLDLIRLNDNMGIAYAHNIGIELAFEKKADYVLLLDQDSSPESDMVEKLKNNLGHIRNKVNKPAVAIGPSYEDPRTKTRSYFMVSRFGFPHRYKPHKEKNPQRIVSVCFLISSGSLIAMDALLQYGGMRSEYFIDHVDTEWSFRIKQKGKLLIGEHDAIMEHSLGDKVKRVWFGYTRSVSYHSPLRDYYMFRNTILMLKDVNMTLVWKIFLLGRLLQFALYFLTFTSKRYQRLSFMMRGIWHGINRITGRLDTLTFKCTPIPKTSFDPK